MACIENDENKESITNSVDFPFICRICLKRSDLRLFKAEDYLLDLYQTITKTDVRSTANLPKYICNDCIKTLQDISLFIDISKQNAAKSGENFMQKNENEHLAECGTSKKLVMKIEGTIDKYTEDLQYFKGFEMCPICYSTNILKPVEGKTHLMQVFQNITNIDVTAEIVYRNNICNNCIKELETISLFISRSLCNEIKLENTIGRNEALEDGNAIVMGYRNEVKKEDDFNKNAHSYESNGLHTIIDIKEEIFNNPEASIEHIYRNGLNTFGENQSQENPFDCPNQDEFSTATHLKNLSEGLDMNWSNLQQNKPIHSGEKPFRCDCCEKSFSQKSNLQRHKLTHSVEMPFDCDGCGKRFAGKGNLLRHKLIHSGEKPFKCDGCEKKFADTGNLLRHKLIHSGEKPFKCDGCEKQFAEKGNLLRHKLIHSGEKPFKCDSCEKSYNRKGHLQQHKLIHSREKPFQCDSCEKKFTEKGNLLRHKLIHSGEKPFKCDVCEKRFTRKWDYRRHKLIHSGKKPFKCDGCEKSFNRKRHLQQHTLIHSRENPFKCDVCEKSFTRKWDCQLHKLIHSVENPFKCKMVA